MFGTFFLDHSPAQTESGVYQMSLVILSYIVASLAAYIFLLLSRKIINATRKAEANFAQWAGAVALGTGVWAMHFIGMLSFKMRMLVAYDPVLTVVSLIEAILFAYGVLAIVKRPHLSKGLILASGVLLGIGISFMHYTGMAAMKMDATLSYKPDLFAASVIIAITASCAALFIATFLSRYSGKCRLCLKITAALVMGAAICGMHFTGMAAAVFIPFAQCAYDPNQDFSALIITVTAVPCVFFILFVFAVSRRLFFIVLGSMIGALPLGIIIYKATDELNAKIAHVDAEMIGLTHHAELFSLMTELQRYRELNALTAYGESAFEETHNKVKETLIKKLGDTTSEHKSDGDGIINGPEWNNIFHHINEHLLEKNGLKSDLQTETGFIAALQQYMLSIADKTGMQADTDRAFNRLATVYTHYMPYMLEHLSQLSQGLVTRLILSTGKEKEEDGYIHQDILLTGLLKMSVLEIHDALNRAQQINGQFVGLLNLFTNEIEPRLALLSTTSDNITAHRHSQTVQGVYAQKSEITLLCLQLYQKISDSLVKQLDVRRQNFERERNIVFSASLLALFSFIILFIFMYRSLVRTEKTENELQRKTTLLDTVLDHMPLALFAKDAQNDFRWLLLNRKAEDLFCLDAEKIIGRSDYDFFPKEEADFFRETDENVMKGKSLVDIEAEPVTTPKGTFTAHTIKVPIYENGKPAILLGMLEDVTERMKARDELHFAKEEAERANHAKSDFLANMSHELRTPLNSILGMLRLLRESQLNDEQNDIAGTVLHSSENLLKIVNDILDLSKIEAGEIELETIGFDPAYVLHSATRTLEPLAKEKKLALQADYEKQTLPYLLGDPLRLTRILTNLIGNAIKYTNDGGVHVRAHTAPTSKNTVLFTCEVEDSGIGIPPEKHQSVFDKFVQADSSTTRKYGGTGLGLAITKQLVELMGGTIGLKSIPGKGSTFWFSIPFTITEKLTESVHARRKSVSRGTLLPSLANVLVAEDHPMNQIFITALLKRFGFEHIRIVENGYDVLKAREQANYDLILMDCHMPMKNGYDTTTDIRALEKGSGQHIPIIAMTANAMVGDREKCLRCGMDDYISKPINADELRTILSEWICFKDNDSSGINTASAGIAPARFDPQHLKKATAGDAVIQKELVTAFLQQSKINIKHLEGAMESDADGWREAAHMIKGGAATIGAPELARYADEAQLAADHFAENVDDRKALLAHIKTAYAALEHILNKH